MTKDEIVQCYAETARPVILQFFPRNSCVASCRITMEVLRRFGIRGQVVPVSMIVEAKAFELAFVTGGVDLKNRAHEVRSSRNGWEGHCIVIAGGYLIDPSFDQCDMSDRGVAVPLYILVSPFASRIKPRSFQAELKLVTDSGVTLDVRYVPLSDWSFLGAPAWETDHIEPAIRMITEKMRRAA